ncbi:MAG: hypothetical protein V4545_10720 [Pseudomonadota bacterium]
MGNNFDLPEAESIAILAISKTCPIQPFRMEGHGKQSYWHFSSGLIVEGEFKRALTIEISVMERSKPAFIGIKMVIFKTEYEVPRRVYQLDLMLPPNSNQGEHNWPHEHIGNSKSYFDNSYPKTFEQCLAYFSQKTNIIFEEPLENPLVFTLKPYHE